LFEGIRSARKTSYNPSFAKRKKNCGEPGKDASSVATKLKR